MKHLWHIVIPLLAIAFGLGYLIFSTIIRGEALEYFKHVDEIMTDPESWTMRPIRLHGFIVANSTLKKTGNPDFRFALQRNGKWVDVEYSGILPDSFQECAELVVIGFLKTPLAFQAHSIQAKCPSKYDGKKSRHCGEKLLPFIQEHRNRK